ncbi:MAG: S9 family peptidase [Bacteroidia bacterium]|nr:S9 family peptidase [Bacteroidia bacterium]
MSAPVANKIPKELTIHGDTRIDNYYWMNERDAPAVIEALNQENAYCDAQMAHTKQFQEDLYNEMVARIKQTDLSVPYRLDDYFYYSRFEEGKEYPIYCRKKESLEAAEDIILNVNELAEGHDYYAAVGLAVSFEQNILAFGQDITGRRQYSLRFRNLETGDFLADEVPNTTGAFAWAADNKTIFYSQKDDALRSYKIFRHTLGTPAEQDVEVFHEADETFSTFVTRSKSKEYIMIGCHSTNSTEYRVLDSKKPNGDFRIILPREDNHEYAVSHFEDKFYIVTNWEAKNFRLMETPVNATGKENWKEVVAHRPHTLLEGIQVFSDHLVLEERSRAQTSFRIMNQTTGSDHYIRFDEPVYSIEFDANPDFKTSILRFSYNSLTTPTSVYDYDMNSKTQTLLKRTEVLGDFDPANYQSERLWAKASDGTEVPISLVYKKGFKRDGSQPMFLTGYGSYGYSYDPVFSSVRLSLLDRGFSYAIAHIRGGQEMGRFWYEQGRMLNKINTFTDFIACAEYLEDEKYTSREKMIVSGGSAGGLLMGAICNLRPDLFKGVLSAVPFVDVVTTMLDTSIPLTTGEYSEWGNPNDKEYYDYIKSYSPYDQIKAQDYPNMLVTTGYTDSQVQYWEPAKYVAKLREMKTDHNQLLFHCDMESGHSGKAGRFSRLKLVALEYAWLLDLLGYSQ